MPILILNVTTGVTFKYKYHKLASLTSQSREYFGFLLQIPEYSSIFSISISSQSIMFTNDQMTAGNAINKRCVLCRDSKYIMSRPSALAAPVPLSSSHHISVLPILQMSLI